MGHMERIHRGAKMIRLILFISAFLLLFGCPQKTAPEIPAPEHEPAPEPEPQPESSLVIYPRESKIPEGAIKITPETDIYPPILHSDEFEEPVPMPYPINTKGAEDSPFITPDGNNFYVWFTPDPQIPVELQVLDGVTAIYWSKKENGQWQEPERLILNDEYSLDGCLFVQGNEAWFCSVRAGNSREIDIWTAELVDGTWTNWENAGEQLNLGYWVGEMHITSDGTQLYYHSEKEDSLGCYDIYVLERVDGIWQPPEPVEAVNTEGCEGWPFVNEEMDELWFTRTYMGSPAIYKSDLINGAWQEPELIISQFAGEPTLDRQGNLYFTHHFYENGTMIEADIYVAYKKD
ncbi:hypothetical protein GF412_03110 [Candidatus Micrarchaeota archaeon]|nr:hypothetical protein [Candidatus Micrarchaeota archaeon]MBD3417942.1 hypothetical protein [Candidatus Micrarchaeota archaeon]